jgi:beta-phosphoglucomutase
MAMRAVIFDFDGVLVDSEPSHYRALRDALAEEGIVIDTDEYARHYLAYTDRECIRVAFERHGHAYEAERVERTALRKAALFDALLAEVPFFDGARDLVAELGRSRPLAIASGALSAEIEHILTAGGLREAFAAVGGGGPGAGGARPPASAGTTRARRWRPGSSIPMKRSAWRSTATISTAAAWRGGSS